MTKKYADWLDDIKFTVIKTKNALRDFAREWGRYSTGTPSTAPMAFYNAPIIAKENAKKSEQAQKSYIDEESKAGKEIQKQVNAEESRRKIYEDIYNATVGRAEYHRNEAEEEQKYNKLKNSLLERVGNNIAAKAYINAYFDDYYYAKTPEEKSKALKLMSDGMDYASLKNPLRSVEANIKDMEAERRKSKQNQSKEEKKEQYEDTAKKEDKEPAKPVVLPPEFVQHALEQTPGTPEYQAAEAAKDLTLGNFFDYTNPYFQYYTAPTALGLGLGGLLGGWKGSLLGAAGGAGLGALAKYLVDNDKIHMA